MLLMLRKPSAPFLGFLQATGLVVYIGMIAWFSTFGPIFDKADSLEFFAPIIMLLLFIISAVISALLVLGRFGVLFWDKHYREAFTLLGWTLGWCFFYFVSTILIAYKLEN